MTAGISPVKKGIAACLKSALARAALAATFLMLLACGAGNDTGAATSGPGEASGEVEGLVVEVTGRNIGTSVDPLSGEPGGPAIRFLELCLPPLGWNLSRQAIRHSIRRTREELA